MPKAPGAAKRPGTVKVQVYLNPSEAVRVRAAADAKGIRSASAYVRGAVLKRLRKDAPPRA